MLLTVTTQFNILIYSVLSGMITGVLFDFYRIIRGFENPNKLMTMIEDFLFWILSSIIIFIFLLYTNYAYIGVYIYLYIALGLFIYFKLVSRYFIIFEFSTIKYMLKFLRIIINNIKYPIQILLNKIK